MRYGQSHKIKNCPAYGKICGNCGLKNHFRIKCRKGENMRVQNQGQVNKLEAVNTLDNFLVSIDALEIMNTEYGSSSNKSWIGKIIMNGDETEIKLDTGAELNVVSVDLLKKMKNIKLNDSKVTIRSFGGYLTKSKGSVLIKLENNNIKLKRMFEVVEYKGLPLLSYEACVRMEYKMPDISEIKSLNKINDKDSFIKTNIDVFEGIGKFPDKVQIKITDNVIPKSNPPRRVPMKISSKLKEQLSRIVKLDIIEPCVGLSEWQSNLVIIQKPDETLRLCLDPREINKYIIRDMYQIPTLDDIKPVLANKSCYSLLDLKDGFYHCVLDDKSSKLCTFSSPFGSYCFKILPFDISMALEVFQKIMNEYFGDIEGVTIYFDNLLISANSRYEHDHIIKKVLERARKLNIKFNAKKLQYAVEQVKFLGLIFKKQGVISDPDRIKSIKELKVSTNKKQLQSFLGMINYIRSFIPNLSEIISPFRELFKKNVLRNWSQQCNIAFDNLKEIICNLSSLKNYESKYELEIQCDASEKALGCCILQNKCPIYYASRFLSESEVSFAQIEKEMLAIAFACNKFHSLIYGRKIKIFSDHLPLISIMKKDLQKFLIIV
jgi:hypothetical protein